MCMWYRVVTDNNEEPSTEFDGRYLQVVEVPVITCGVSGELLPDIKRKYTTKYTGVCVVKNGKKRVINFDEVFDYGEHVAGKPLGGISRLTSMGGH